MGSGPVLVKAANWLTHLDHDRETFVWRHWLAGLARGRTLVRYDERGCGMSDWNVDRLHVRRLGRRPRAGRGRRRARTFPLLGVSQGAAVAVAFAARHPERVSTARSLRVPTAVGGWCGRRPTRSGARRRWTSRSPASGWGRDDPSFRQMFTSQFLPDGTREQWEEFNELQRRTTSAAQRRALPRDVRRDRRHGHRPEGPLPDARHALPGRPAGAVASAPRAGGADPRRPAGLAAEPQPHPPRRAGVAGVPRRDRLVPRRGRVRTA